MELFLRAYMVFGFALGEVLKRVVGEEAVARWLVPMNIGLAVVLSGTVLGWTMANIVDGLEAGLAAVGLFELAKTPQRFTKNGGVG